MQDQLINRWWIVAIRGAVAVMFGVAALLAPDKAMAVFVSLFGFFALADGVFATGAGLAANWLSLFCEGIVGLAIGMFTMMYPPMARFWFAELIIAWAFVIGVLEISGALGIHAKSGPLLRGEYLLGASGVITIGFGILLALRGEVGTLAFAWIIGAYAIVSGVLLLALAFNVRTWPRVLQPPTAA